jgi:15-cis-phytoene synthase
VTRDRALQSSYRFCNTLARREARNFYYAFLLLPPAQRRAMCALYAYMRHTDDLADGPGSTEHKAAALAAWRGQLRAALAGEDAPWPGLAALADTVAHHAIPAELLFAVIEGVSMDLEPRTLVTFNDLADYCYHVASVVGLSCLHIWGYRSDGGRAEELATQCGVALQLTNILRDVATDARNGRIYLPLDDLSRFHVDPMELAATGHPGDRLRALLAFEGQRAYGYYNEVRSLVPLVEPCGRPVLLAIVGIYRALLDEIARRDYNVFTRRVAVPPWRKISIALRALAG